MHEHNTRQRPKVCMSPPPLESKNPTSLLNIHQCIRTGSYTTPPNNTSRVNRPGTLLHPLVTPFTNILRPYALLFPQLPLPPLRPRTQHVPCIADTQSPQRIQFAGFINNYFYIPRAAHSVNPFLRRGRRRVRYGYETQRRILIREPAELDKVLFGN